MPTKKAEKYVLVTTEHRGVFAGYATDTDGETIKLRQARNCVYWSAAVKGFSAWRRLARMQTARSDRLRTLSCARSRQLPR